MNHFEPDSTHDPERKSWVESSRDPASEFPLQNLPWCVFREPDQERQFVGVGIGDRILNVRLAAELSCFAMLGDHSLNDSEVRALKADDLGQVMSLSSASRRRLRRALFELLSQDCGALRDFESMWDAILVRQTDVELVLPTRIGDYTDFYASIHHATHVGMMLRPENPLLPNYKWIPVGYHGRGSSIVVSGTPIRRPAGQVAPANDGGAPTFKPCGNLDYELEMGIWIASGNTLGQPIPMAEAEDHFFGVSLLNDWSARDIQKWEYQPLGPFLAKNFATSISPWIVTREALTPFRCPAAPRGPGDPQPLPHLDGPEHRAHGGLEISVEVHLSSKQMREAGLKPVRLSLGNFSDMYWTIGQFVTHHTSNGCNLRPGDLLGSGTISGPRRESRGCLLELTWDGDKETPKPGTQRTPLVLPTGEKRIFLADGDEVTLRGYAEGAGRRRIVLGECRGEVLPASGPEITGT